jgi:membrane-associated phospholipid phosphatase
MNISKIAICVLVFCYCEALFGQDILQEIETEEVIADKQSENVLPGDSMSIQDMNSEFIANYNETLSFQNQSNNSSVVPLSKLFYKIGSNAFHSVTYNYGANYAVAAVGTYAMIESGIDWKWNRMGYNNKWVAYSGTPFGALGYILPVAAPVWLYVHGRRNEDIKLQVTGLALGQAALLGLGVSGTIKAFTGRLAPGIMEHHIYPDRYMITDDYSNDWAWGFMRRGVNSGWPSSHTIVAFAMATTLAELYPDNTWLKIGAFAYAGCTGLSVSLFSHWASEVFAGALMGYAIGKSVGRSFNGLLGNDTKLNYSFYAVPNGIGFTMNF